MLGTAVLIVVVVDAVDPPPHPASSERLAMASVAKTVLKQRLAVKGDGPDQVHNDQVCGVDTFAPRETGVTGHDPYLLREQFRDMTRDTPQFNYPNPKELRGHLQ
jgi:hypothetical protein